MRQAGNEYETLCMKKSTLFNNFIGSKSLFVYYCAITIIVRLYACVFVWLFACVFLVSIWDKSLQFSGKLLKIVTIWLLQSQYLKNILNITQDKYLCLNVCMFLCMYVYEVHMYVYMYKFLKLFK